VQNEQKTIPFFTLNQQIDLYRSSSEKNMMMIEANMAGVVDDQNNGVIRQDRIRRSIYWGI